jgi:hypothetical protein
MKNITYTRSRQLLNKLTENLGPGEKPEEIEIGHDILQLIRHPPQGPIEQKYIFDKIKQLAQRLIDMHATGHVALHAKNPQDPAEAAEQAAWHMGNANDREMKKADSRFR